MVLVEVGVVGGGEASEARYELELELEGGCYPAERETAPTTPVSTRFDQRCMHFGPSLCFVCGSRLCVFVPFEYIGGGRGMGGGGRTSERG